jgi:hypothetical protein
MMKNPLYRKDMRENEKNDTNEDITMAWNAVEAYEDKNKKDKGQGKVDGSKT